MPQYEVGKRWFIPLLGRTPDVGEVIELPEDLAEQYMHNEPGLMKPVRRTTQAEVTAVRSDEAPARRPRKPRKSA